MSECLPRRRGASALRAVLFAGCCALGCAPLAAAEPAMAAPTDASDRTGRLIVKWRDAVAGDRRQTMSVQRAHRLSVDTGVALAPLHALSDGAQVLALPQALPMREMRALARRVAADPAIEYAEPDAIRRPMLVPTTEPLYGSQWYFSSPTAGVRMPGAWDVTTGSAAVTIAIIDSGILPTHPEFNGRIAQGYDFISPDGVGNFFTANDGDGRDPDPSDPGDWVTAQESQTQTDCAAADSSWHGTYVAGLIAAAGDNGEGMAGADWFANILPVRVLGKCGGYISDIAEAIRWAVGRTVAGVNPNNTPAQILNLSFGGPGTCSQSEQNAINEARSAGAVVIVAAGNGDHTDASQYSPANCSGVIVVGATDSSGSLADYTNIGPLVTLSAPGGGRTLGAISTGNSGTTVPAVNNYGAKIGTSTAAALVTGAAALMLTVQPGLTPDEVCGQLRATARAFPDASCTTSTCGAGILDAQQAVESVRGAGPFASCASPAPASSGGGGGGGDAGSLLLALGALCLRGMRPGRNRNPRRARRPATRA